MASRRWDIDEVGHGIASGDSMRPELARLDAALALPDWVAEEPDAHLLPHIRQACAASVCPVELVDSRITDDATLEVRLRPRGGASLGVGMRRAAAFGVLSSFAEDATFVHSRIEGPDLVVDIATGQLDGDGPFAGHGHLVRLIVAEGGPPP